MCPAAGGLTRGSGLAAAGGGGRSPAAAPWTDDESHRLAQDAEIAGLAWALGSDHPVLRAEVQQDATAAATVVLVRPHLITHPAIEPASRPAVAAEVLAARRGLTDPALIRAAAAWPSTAARVLVMSARTAPALLAAAAQTAETAAEVLAARRAQPRGQ